MSYFTRVILKGVWRKVKKMDDARIATLTMPDGITEHVDLPYLPDGNLYHLLDVYYPDNTDRPLPVVLDIHGGGWMYGDKELNKPFCLSLASMGFAVVNMSYRLAPEANLKDMIQDIFAALEWIATNGSDYHLNLDRFFITGDSAGGHLSSMTACVQNSVELQQVFGVRSAPLDIKAVGPTHGVFNFRALDLKGVNGAGFREMSRMLLNNDPENCPWRDCADFISAYPSVKALPPFFILSSEPDALSPQSRLLDAFLMEHGCKHVFKFWTKEQNEKLQHVFNITQPDWPESRESNREMLDYFLANAGSN